MTQRITSLQNEYIKSLCLLHHASERRKTGLFLIESAKLCEEALRSGWPVEQCLVTEKEANHPALNGVENKIVISEPIAKKLSSMDTPPGIFMVLRQQAAAPEADPDFILALDHLSDPSNLGAVLRSAEAFGAGLVFISDGSVDLYSPKTLRAAMGSAFRVPVMKGDLADFLLRRKKSGYSIYGAGLDRQYKNLPEISFNDPSIVVIGNESGGISPEIIRCCDSGLYIPMLGNNESLNAAVAASIILWEQSKWR